MELKTYRVRGIDVNHDEKHYPEGSLIELDDAAAQELRRWLEPAVIPEAAQPARPGKAGKADKADKADDKGLPADGSENKDTAAGGQDNSQGDKQ